jgi:hypothetical protein
MPWEGGTNPQAALCRLVFLEKLVRHQTVWEIGGCQGGGKKTRVEIRKPSPDALAEDGRGGEEQLEKGEEQEPQHPPCR